MITRIKRMGKRGEIVLPKLIRTQSGLAESSDVKITCLKNGILLTPLKNDISSLAGLFGDKGSGNLEELDATLLELIGTQ